MISETRRFLICVVLFSFYGCNNANKVSERPKDVVDGFEEILIRENRINNEVTFVADDSLKIRRSTSVYLGKCVNGNCALVSRGVLSGNRISPHFSAYLNVYSSSGLKMGTYNLGSNDSLKLIDANLIIHGIGDCNQTTQISFRDSIPKEIFVHCKEESGKVYGDTYDFVEQ